MSRLGISLFETLEHKSHEQIKYGLTGITCRQSLLHIGGDSDVVRDSGDSSDSFLRVLYLLCDNSSNLLHRPDESSS